MRPESSRGREQEPRINNRIRAREVRLIDKNGQQVGVVPLPKALVMAREDGLDVVEVQPNVFPPVCKILDYGRYKYDLKKKAKESRKKQHVVEEKQVRLRVNTGPHDVATKIRHARQFLEEGHRVIFTIRLRGREFEHKAEARVHFDNCRTILADIAKVDMDIREEGATMMMGMAPLPKKGRPSKPAAAAAAPKPVPAPTPPPKEGES